MFVARQKQGKLCVCNTGGENSNKCCFGQSQNFSGNLDISLEIGTLGNFSRKHAIISRFYLKFGRMIQISRTT